MPRTKYRAGTHIPRLIVELRTDSPTELREAILRKFNKAVTSQSISMWFKRNPEKYEEAMRKVREMELPQEEVLGSIFENGTFEELESVKTWITDMKMPGRQLARDTIRSWVSLLKRICQGKFPGKKLAKGEKPKVDLTDYGWSWKHPDRLNIEDCVELIHLAVENHPDLDLANHTRVMRGFLKSKGIDADAKIPAPESLGAGKMSDLFVERPVLQEILDSIASFNFEAYVADHVMFKTAGRVNAVLAALLDNLTELTKRPGATLKIFDKGKRSKFPNGRPWDKYLSPDLLKEISELTGYPERTRGPIFTLTETDMADINRKALEKFRPELFDKHPNLMPNHFWRHMFAQHMLRKTGWNYAAVAALGGWSVTALERSYGKPPQEQVREWGMDQIPDL